MEIVDDHAQFLTATILDWKPVLESDETKKIIINSLRFLHHNQRAFIYGFVIMSNHLHLIWQMRDGHLRQDVQRDFLKYTAQKIKLYLATHNPKILEELELNLSDRKFQIWKRGSLNVPLYSHKVFVQKLDYIHLNPVKAGICSKPTLYHYSSAKFYYEGDRTFDFLSHHMG